MEATMRIPIDATQRAGNATPPPTIPFLFYDEQKGVWVQDGVATLTGSGANAVYEKKIKHFSTMNADILKTGQSCVAVEVDPAANFTLPFDVEVTMQPSVVNPNVIQVRTLTVDSTKSNVIYNLPVNLDIALTPIISGVRPDGFGRQHSRGRVCRKHRRPANLAHESGRPRILMALTTGRQTE
jgi:hypothetical protein